MSDRRMQTPDASKGLRITSDAYLYEVSHTSDTEPSYLLSPIPPDQARATGLPPEGILGQLTSGPDLIDPEHFQPNPVFVQFLHWVLAKHASSCPGLLAEAERQQNGFVHIVDARTDAGDIPPEDLIASVEVKDGQLLRYGASPSYRVLTDAGLLKLDGWLHARLLEELAALSNR
jgi:hypothetical protein